MSDEGERHDNAVTVPVAATGVVAAVHRDAGHHFSKQPAELITLVAGVGVQGDAHSGATVRHRSRVAVDPSQPNLRQVHLIPGELFDELERAGYTVAPGELGENITTGGIDLASLPVGATLRLGDRALVVLTGLRNPCGQINGFRPGLLDQVLHRDRDGTIVRRAGVMGVVVEGGLVTPGDAVTVALPPLPHRHLERV